MLSAKEARAVSEITNNTQDNITAILHMIEIHIKDAIKFNKSSINIGDWALIGNNCESKHSYFIPYKVYNLSTPKSVVEIIEITSFQSYHKTILKELSEAGYIVSKYTAQIDPETLMNKTKESIDIKYYNISWESSTKNSYILKVDVDPHNNLYVNLHDDLGINLPPLIHIPVLVEYPTYCNLINPGDTLANVLINSLTSYDKRAVLLHDYSASEWIGLCGFAPSLNLLSINNDKPNLFISLEKSNNKDIKLVIKFSATKFNELLGYFSPNEQLDVCKKIINMFFRKIEEVISENNTHN